MGLLCFIFLSMAPLPAEQTSADETGIPGLSAAHAREAVLAAAETFNGIRSKDGAVSLLNLQLQSNTLAGILHNLIGREVAKRASYWRFLPSGAAGGDLVGQNDEPLELKTSSDLTIKGNQISHNVRYYLATHFVLYPQRDRLAVVWVRSGKLTPEDWQRPAGTQWAFVTPAGETHLKTLWKNFGDLPTSHLPVIGEKREQTLSAAGIDTVRQFSEAPSERLREILKMSAEQVERARREAKALMGEGSPPKAEAVNSEQ